jgi:hypothetical protein
MEGGGDKQYLNKRAWVGGEDIEGYIYEKGAEAGMGTGMGWEVVLRGRRERLRTIWSGRITLGEGELEGGSAQ